jgi:beta-alanine--pyruvate transaminase
MERVRELAPHFEAAVHTLKGAKHVGDVRNFGLAAGITLLPAPGEPAKRPYQVAMKMYDMGFYLRNAGDCVALAPPFVSTRAEIDNVVNALGEALAAVD